MKSLAVTALIIAGSVSQALAAEPAAKPIPKSSIEVFHIAPGQHENFLKTLMQVEALSKEVGLEPNDLYIHDSGASWDFIIIKREGQDPQRIAALFKKLQEAGFPSGPDYFFESRKTFASHEDTQALGPTTATAYMATRKQKK